MLCNHPYRDAVGEFLSYIAETFGDPIVVNYREDNRPFNRKSLLQVNDDESVSDFTVVGLTSFRNGEFIKRERLFDEITSITIEEEDNEVNCIIFGGSFYFDFSLKGATQEQLQKVKELATKTHSIRFRHTLQEKVKNLLHWAAETTKGAAIHCEVRRRNPDGMNSMFDYYKNASVRIIEKDGKLFFAIENAGKGYISTAIPKCEFVIEENAIFDVAYSTDTGEIVIQFDDRIAQSFLLFLPVEPKPIPEELK